MVSSPDNSLHEKETPLEHPSHSDTNQNGSHHAEVTPRVTNAATQIFPPDKPTQVPGSILGDPKGGVPQQNVSTTTPITDLNFKEAGRVPNVTSNGDVVSPVVSAPQTSELQTTITPGKSTVQPYKDDSQSHVHSEESSVSTIASGADLGDRLVVKHENISSSSSSPTSSSLQTTPSTSLTPVKPPTTSSLSTHRFIPTIANTTQSEHTTTSPDGPATIIPKKNETSSIPERTLGLSSSTQSSKTSTSNSDKDVKFDLTLPQFTTGTHIPSSLGSVIVRSKTSIFLTTKSLLKAATTPKVPSTTTPPVGSSHTTNRYYTTREKASNNNGEMRIPLEKISVATLSRSAATNTSGMQGTIAAIVLPVIGLLVILAIIVFIVRRRKVRNSRYRRKDIHDEENSTEATAALMSAAIPNGTQLNSTEEPLYAVVDMSKKRKNTESLSVTDETVPLKNFAVTTNGSCPLSQGSEDSLLRVSTARDEVEDVFPVEGITKIDDQPLYDVPPDESKLDAEEAVLDQLKDIDSNGCVYDIKQDRNALVDVAASTTSGNGQDSSVEGQQLEDLTLVECDIYETAEADDSNDSTYEIPDSPATVRARKSMQRRSRGSRPCSIKVPVKISTGDSSDSESELDSDFEEIASRARTYASGESNDLEELNKDLVPPPLPVLPPESDNDSELYMSPECHTHGPPGPYWKPFHEYDPVYIPHSDPEGMDRRVDNQNYVRGRQRSDSRMTHPYEEIQFGGIYATVDDEDSLPVAHDGQPETPARKPPLPPPLVPRRTRPISGIADMGRLSIHRAIEPEKSQEPRYSGLIKDDVSDPDDETPHEYTPLEYTKLRTQESGPMISDDIKLMDDTDSETYTKHAAPPLLKRRSSGDVKDVLPNGDKNQAPYFPLIRQEEDQDKAKGLTNHVDNEDENDHHDDHDDKNNSSDSDDSYEPVDFNPPDYSHSPTKEGS